MNRFMIKWRKRDKFPHIVICYLIKDINIILIDIGYNRGNNNYWFDFRLFGLGFDYDSYRLESDWPKFRFIHDYKGGLS